MVSAKQQVLQGSTETDERIGIRRCVLEIERESSRVRPIVPIATTDEANDVWRAGGEVRVEDAELRTTAT